MPELGTISGQIRLDVKQAVAAYAAMRAANASTLYALRGAGSIFVAFGKTTAAVGVGLVAVFAKAVNSAAEFERKMDFFGAVTAATTEQMELARQEALRLGRDTIYSAGQIADAFVELGKAGVGVEDIVNGIGEAVTNLGAAADIPLDQAARIITSAVQTFELGADKATHVADLLAAAANASIVEVEDLGVSLKYVGGVAASISIPIEDVITALSLLGKAGIRGSTAGTSLRQILVSLMGTSKKAEGVLRDLGIITEDGANKFFRANGEAKSLSEIFQILNEATADMGENQRLAAFKTIFNNRALAAANILTREGAAGFAEMNEELGKTTAADVAAARLDNLSGDIEILRGNIETLFIEAGAPFQEWLRGIVQSVTRLIQVFSQLSPETQKLIFQIIAISGAALVTLGVLSLFIGMVLRLVAGAKLLGSAIKLLWAVFSAVGKGIGKVIAFFMRITRVAQGLGAIFRVVAAGVRIVVVALAGLTAAGAAVAAAIAVIVGALIWFFGFTETGRALLRKWGESLATAWDQAKTAWAAAVRFLSETWASFVNFLQTAWNGLVTAFNAVVTFFQQLPTTVSNLVQSVVQSVVTWFDQMPGKVSASFERFITAVGNFFARLPGLAGYWIGFMVGRTVRLLYDLYVRANEIFNQVVDAIVKWVSQLPGKVGNWFNRMKTRAIQIAAQFVVSAIRKAQEIYNGIVDWISKLPGRVAEFFSRTKSRAQSIATTWVSNMIAKARELYNKVADWIGKLPGRVGEFISRMRQRALEIFRRFVQGAINLAKNIVDRVRSALNALPGIVSGVFNRVVGAIKGVISAAFNAVRDFASGLWEGFKKGLGISSPSFIERAMWSITGTLRDELKVLRNQVMSIRRAGRDLAAPIESGRAAAIKSMTNKMVREARFLKATQEELMALRSQQTREMLQRLPALTSTFQVVGRDDEDSGTPLIGVQNVYNPLNEPASQTAAREATRKAQLGR